MSTQYLKSTYIFDCYSDCFSTEMFSFSQGCLIHSPLDIIAYGLLVVTSVIILSHITSKIYNLTKPHLKLSQSSQVVITGGCLGIGREMALQIAKLFHCKILIVDYRKDLFAEITQLLQELGSKVECYQCDLADDSSVQQFITELNKRNKSIDLFIHNAGVHIPKPALLTTQKQLLYQYKVNFLSPVKIIRQTIDLLQNGHIAVIASMIVLVHGGMNVATYSSSKNALYSYVNSLRQQLKADHSKTTISMGCPYMINTGMFDGFKTRLDFLFRHLEPKYVAKRLVKEFIQKKEICYIFQYELLLFRIINFLPTELLDLLSIHFNNSNFASIQNRHDSRLKDGK